MHWNQLQKTRLAILHLCLLVMRPPTPPMFPKETMAHLLHHRPDVHWGLAVWARRPFLRSFLSQHLSHVPQTLHTVLSIQCRHSLRQTRQERHLKARDH